MNDFTWTLDGIRLLFGRAFVSRRQTLGSTTQTHYTRHNETHACTHARDATRPSRLDYGTIHSLVRTVRPVYPLADDAATGSDLCVPVPLIVHPHARRPRRTHARFSVRPSASVRSFVRSHRRRAHCLRAQHAHAPPWFERSHESSDVTSGNNNERGWRHPTVCRTLAPENEREVAQTRRVGRERERGQRGKRKGAREH